MESFNGKYYTTNNESYTKEHNDIMDQLLSTYVISCDTYSMPGIGYNSENESYYPINEEGAKVLEHLLNCDLISVVAD